MIPASGEAAEAGHSLLERFARALARIVHHERPDALSRSITVAELYQDIAPYRRMRELAGLELHGDYEHALIRFLAGEGGYALLDPSEAADELGIEAESSDPDLSLYRKFAACDVRLSLQPPADDDGADTSARPEPPPALPIAELAARAQEEARAAEAETRAAEAAARAAADARATRRPVPDAPAASVEETLRALGGSARPAAPSPSRPAATPALASPSASAPQARRGAARCAFCGQGLPVDREVRYCPHCGVDQSAQACGSCGADMEAGWRFCVACGAAADA